MTEDIDSYVRQAKAHGLADSTIIGLLHAGGWPERRAYRSLGGYYDETVGIRLPARPSGADAARDAFMYVLNFLTLGFWTVALGNLCYILIGRAFPDPGTSSTYGQLIDQIAWQLAATLVALPACLAINRIIAGQLRVRRDLAESAVRGWLTYAALVIGALVVLVDGISFVEALLRGEVTIRFVLDSLVLLFLGGGVIGYYLTGLRAAGKDAA
jgi:hypothetical protein